MNGAGNLRFFLVFLLFGKVAFPAVPEIKRLAVEKFEDGPAVHSPDGFVAGETVYFSFLLEGYGKKDDKVEISFEARPKDPDGILLTPPVTGSTKIMLTPEDKGWVPKLRGSFLLPVELFAGKYQLQVQVTDGSSGVTLADETMFLVEGPKAKPSATLAIQDFEFVRSEEDSRPMQVAAYRVEEEVHAKFTIVGYKHNNQGAIDVSYGISLTDSQVHVLFSQESVAHDTTAEFYAKPFIPGVLSFNLKPGTPPGEFTLHITARDTMGGETVEVARKFRME